MFSTIFIITFCNIKLTLKKVVNYRFFKLTGFTRMLSKYLSSACVNEITNLALSKSSGISNKLT